jgi:hypothetical protein
MGSIIFLFYNSMPGHWIKCYIDMFSSYLVDIAAISSDDLLQVQFERAAGPPDHRLA